MYRTCELGIRRSVEGERNGVVPLDDKDDGAVFVLADGFSEFVHVAATSGSGSIREECDASLH
jgi:hypothetical protein